MMPFMRWQFAPVVLVALLGAGCSKQASQPGRDVTRWQTTGSEPRREI
jgi:hypothetical protein